MFGWFCSAREYPKLLVGYETLLRRTVPDWDINAEKAPREPYHDYDITKKRRNGVGIN